MTWVPKIVTVLREGYGLADLRSDALAGLTVAIVALPLAMALAIASGVAPEKGLITAVVAGFLISALGGSRLQIGGPTGAFVVVVASVIATHGYGGLLLATLMAGALLLVAALARFGDWIRYIPDPVVTGFTAGIAVIIATSQVGDAFGLSLASSPPAFIEKVQALWSARDSASLPTLALTAVSLGALVALPRLAPRLPAFLIVVVVSAAAVFLLRLPVETIGARFGTIAATIPAPDLAGLPWGTMRELVPAAFTIAFLAGIESLLSAKVADSMTGRRHRSNAELMAQGWANIASALFGGLPATGAIARTATNVRAGGRSPVAGMMHAGFLLAFWLLLAPLLRHVPLAALAAVLFVVAWRMAERHKVVALTLRAPAGDRVMMLATFALTVFVDLTTAIAVGVTLAALRFVHRMAQSVSVSAETAGGLAVLTVRGPLFFGVTGQLIEAFERLDGDVRSVVIRLSESPLVDASGIEVLANVIRRAKERGLEVRLVGLQPQPEKALQQMGVLEGLAWESSKRQTAPA